MVHSVAQEGSAVPGCDVASDDVGLRTGEARVGDVVTPLRPITQNNREPKFFPGDILTVTSGQGGTVLTVQDASGKSGVWSCCVFRFVTPKTSAQLFRAVTEDFVAALAPLKVMGRSVVGLDTHLLKAFETAQLLIAKATTEPQAGLSGDEAEGVVDQIPPPYGEKA